ncbi:unnamed protein product [Mycena citricolor]|uniref:Btz domain-containing protein n=1 Tax=Mycena citricolor TaxID=2018698 RepID=A0AAD2GUS7_9AGAR|nr:unnamed protein product [Mycena citricolor]
MPARRRPRGRRTGHADLDEDDDVVRAAPSDSEDDSTHGSSTDSDSDDDDGSASHHHSPNTSHSPGADEKPTAPFFSGTSTAWADMVEDTEGLPVISFGELDESAIRKVQDDRGKDADKQEPEQGAEEDRDDEDGEQPVASSSRPSPGSRGPFVSRAAGQTARQAYQSRLESDPSFVPVVGEFWGHDDRLLDKDLRSLSGWWRGRWQTRGRARGGFAFRGRGGPFNRPALSAPESEPQPNSPVDRAWTHDGFEEMRRREETFRPRGGAAPRGNVPVARGAAALRGRGVPLNRTVPGRIWYTMKPEYMWTKQHDAFLYSEPSLKPRPGQSAGIRVHLPGKSSTVVRLVSRPVKSTRSKPAALDEEYDYAVRLPSVRDNVPGVSAPVVEPSKPVPTTGLEPDEDGWVRPDAAAAAIALAVMSSPPSLPPQALPAPIPQTHAALVAPPGFYPFAAPTSFAFPAMPAYASPPPHAGYAAAQPTPPPGFATHTPPPQFGTPPPPQFGTPPGFSAPLPPGVALDVNGMPYEMSSGRHVMLQPQVPVYASYHHHTPSMSMGGPDPSLFSFPRNSRIEIRDPRAPKHPLSPLSAADPAGKLRSSASAFVPSHSASPSLAGGDFQLPFDGMQPPPPPTSQGGYDAYGNYVPSQFFYNGYYPPPPPPPDGAVYY